MAYKMEGGIKRKEIKRRKWMWENRVKPKKFKPATSKGSGHILIKKPVGPRAQ